MRTWAHSQGVMECSNLKELLPGPSHLYGDERPIRTVPAGEGPQEELGQE